MSKRGRKKTNVEKKRKKQNIIRAHIKAKRYKENPKKKVMQQVFRAKQQTSIHVLQMPDRQLDRETETDTQRDRQVCVLLFLEELI